MKLGLLGDIHGNASALEAVLSAAKREHVDALCVTGDYVGYYYGPGKVLEMLAEWTTYSVRGNHEQMLAQVLAEPSKLTAFEARYGNGLRCALDQLSGKQQHALTTMPVSMVLSFDDCTITLAHGSPWDTDQYIYPDAEPTVLQKLVDCPTDLVVLGHTHYRFHKILGACQIANPGSVGQPRDRIPGAAWATFDTATKVYQAFTEPYDMSQLISDVSARDPHLPYLHEVLTRQ